MRVGDLDERVRGFLPPFSQLRRHGRNLDATSPIPSPRVWSCVRDSCDAFLGFLGLSVLVPLRLNESFWSPGLRRILLDTSLVPTTC